MTLMSSTAILFPGHGKVLSPYRRGAKALGYIYDARLRGLSQPAKAGIVDVARDFSRWATGFLRTLLMS